MPFFAHHINSNDIIVYFSLALWHRMLQTTYSAENIRFALIRTYKHYKNANTTHRYNKQYNGKLDCYTIKWYRISIVCWIAWSNHLIACKRSSKSARVRWIISISIWKESNKNRLIFLFHHSMFMFAINDPSSCALHFFIHQIILLRWIHSLSWSEFSKCLGKESFSPHFGVLCLTFFVLNVLFPNIFLARVNTFFTKTIAQKAGELKTKVAIFGIPSSCWKTMNQPAFSQPLQI